MHPAAALAARGRSAEDPGVVAAAFVPVALGLLALILMVAAVQTVGAAILPGCLGYRGLSRAAVLKVRIHLPPAESHANSIVQPSLSARPEAHVTTAPTIKLLRFSIGARQ